MVTLMQKLKKYFRNILISIIQLVNTLLGGDPDETLSSRLGKLERRGNKLAIFICKILDFFDDCHCQNAIEEDEGKDKVID